MLTPPMPCRPTWALLLLPLAPPRPPTVLFTELMLCMNKPQLKKETFN